MPCALYIGLQDDDRIAAFAVDAETGGSRRPARHEEVMNTIRLFGEQVIPRFQ